MGHVLSSVILGFIGIAIGLSTQKIEAFESFRGSLAAYLFIAFGLAYMVWGVRRGIKNKPHKHAHVHKDGTIHNHEHTHFNEHSHVHTDGKKVTPWVLFIIFFLGPCEILVPLLMYPAAQHNFGSVISISLVFSLATILTMLFAVTALYFGLQNVKLGKIERYAHAIAGFTIMFSGILIEFVGL